MAVPPGYAQEYLGQMPAANCVQLGGVPDSTITDDNNPDPPRNCWRHHTSTQGDAATGASTGVAAPAPVVSNGGGGTDQTGNALQAGGAALTLFGQFLQNFEDSQQPAYDENAAKVDAYFAQKAAEERALRQQAHALNEEGRAAAAQGQTAVAMVKFQLALDNAEQAGDAQNADIYRDNMNTMRAYIAYDSGLRSWKSGDYPLAKKKFSEAIHLAQLAGKNELVKDMKDQIASLSQGVSAAAPPAERADSQCTQVNGQLLCQ